MSKRILGVVSAMAILLSNVAAATPPGMTEVEEVVAKMQIQELMYRYALTHNTDNAEAYAALFTEDADLMGVKGRAAILKMAQGEVEKLGALGVTSEGDYKFGFMRTQIINPVIDIIDPTHAKGVAYLQVVVPNVDNNNIPTILNEGTYQDEYRKVDGKWLIAKRRSTSSKMSYPGLGAKLGLGPAAKKPESQKQQ